MQVSSAVLGLIALSVTSAAAATTEASSTAASSTSRRLLVTLQYLRPTLPSAGGAQGYQHRAESAIGREKAVPKM
ncbi:hypothetical protein LMH87_010869 [Akanthomyces muscarius]|uniref:Uncharacterized protein n=1 Tax=Akanthomyces muscarius TaxID=2231603 RepID=A0A9W8QBC0_AKAMU|nr:hypothetical protein LMH87_010869 [Akanthomyces muscarius]KAJ4150103.1 hypothetical protein LMH87_010869 [Akanthomyces muscarius]